MLADSLPLASNGWRALQASLQDHQSLHILLACAASYAAWWLWRFSISPWVFSLECLVGSLFIDIFALYPQSNPTIGHGVSFLNNSQELFKQARKHFGNSNEPLQLTLFGISVYFVSRAEDVSEAYRNMRTLTVDEFYRAVFLSMGASTKSVDKAFAPLPEHIIDPENPQRKPVAQIAREMQITQLQPGPGLDALERAELDYLEDNVTAEAVRATHCRYPDLLGGETAGANGSVELPLWQWCADVMVRAAQEAFFGSALEKIDPDLPEKFVEFDNIGWKLLYQFPGFLARDTLGKRDELHAALKAFCDLPRGERSDVKAWVIDSTEDKLRALGIPTEDIASILLILYWGTNTNTRKAAFWLICYLLHNPALIDTIRTETAAAFGPDGTIADLAHLHHNCPELDAVWNETMRLTGVAASVRTVTADTVIGGRTLRAGNRLIIPYRQLHLEQRIFGEDNLTFRPSRFQNNGKSKTGERVRMEHFRPFGGGSTICPGRFITKRVVVLFVALLLRRFDISMAGGHQPMPTAEEWRPVLGVIDVKPGDDMRIRLTPRKA